MGGWLTERSFEAIDSWQAPFTYSPNDEHAVARIDRAHSDRARSASTEDRSGCSPCASGTSHHLL